ESLLGKGLFRSQDERTPEQLQPFLLAMAVDLVKTIASEFVRVIRLDLQAALKHLLSFLKALEGSQCLAGAAVEKDPLRGQSHGKLEFFQCVFLLSDVEQRGSEVVMRQGVPGANGERGLIVTNRFRELFLLEQVLGQHGIRVKVRRVRLLHTPY